MPIGIRRLNDRHPQPSSQIVFIKPLPGPDEKYAKDFLERIAAICHPIMKSNHLSIMTLEEHEPNREFVGRNFNAGEIIQLVLKSQSTGRWLSFRTVQLVMVHELAHCQQMNHSRNFWNVRNQYAVELRELWQKRYTGDGLWGRGRTLLSEAYDNGGNEANDVLPEHLCGGAYRNSRRRKRKVKASSVNVKTETYAEKKQRRLAKRFGVSGQTLGGDLDQRVKLEYGQVKKGNPRVASSARGRELRVAAVLARLEAQKDEPAEEKNAQSSDDAKKSGVANSADDESDSTEDESVLGDDSSRMIKVCEDDDVTDSNVKQELDEIRRLEASGDSQNHAHEDVETTDDEGVEIPPEAQDSERRPSNPPTQPPGPNDDADTTDEEGTSLHREGEEKSVMVEAACPICSMSNEAGSLRCTACAHVLDTRKVPGSWQCQDDQCSGSYINAGDCNICGICGRAKSNAGTT